MIEFFPKISAPKPPPAPQPKVISVEFFPPKNEQAAAQMLATAETLRGRGISFASVTCGAGGADGRDRTFDYAAQLRSLGYRVVPHVTCVGHTRAELEAIADRILDAGFEGVMALRGDPPKGASTFTPPAGGLAHASELVALFRERERRRGGAGASGKPLAIGVAGYPDKHPESPDRDADIAWLRHKVNQGANFITSQLFFNCADFFDFETRCRQAGIHVPILPGILPALSLAQVQKFTALSNCSVPPEFIQRMEAAGDAPEPARRAGAAWAIEQIRHLLANGATGVHLYILNRTESALEILDALDADNTLKY